MSKFDVKIGDIVHTQIGIGEVVAISKTKKDFDGKNGRWPGMCDKTRVRERRF